LAGLYWWVVRKILMEEREVLQRKNTRIKWWMKEKLDENSEIDMNPLII
jgi:hypothetical protein